MTPRSAQRTSSVAAFPVSLLLAGVMHSSVALATEKTTPAINEGLTAIYQLAVYEMGEPKAAPVRTAPQEKPVASPRYITLTIGGDLGFGGSGQVVSPTSGVRHGRRISYSDLTRNIRDLLKNSDLAFANLETVVTATNGLSAADKTFNFRMHPNGVAHLVKAGFNLLSTANNHAIDYGLTGMRHTLKHMDAMKSVGLLAAHGVAASSIDLFKPARFSKKGGSFVFAAAGIGGPRAKLETPGQVHFRSDKDLERITQALRQARADYRILSLHYGQELQVRPDAKNHRKLLAASAGPTGADLIIGHHAHTPAGMQRVGDKLVFYGLGNLLHLGMQDMGKYNFCRDFGVMAKLHLVSSAATNGRLVARAVELFALKDMHLVSKVRTGQNGRQRISVINYLSAELADKGKAGVKFAMRENGSGLYCAPGAKGLKGPVGKLCKDWRAPTPPIASVKKKLQYACRYMRKSSSSARVAKLRGTKKAIKNKSVYKRAFARNAFEPNN